MGLKASFYNHYITQNSKQFVYNLLSTAIIELDENIFELIKNNQIDRIDKSIKESLISEGIIVKDNVDESLIYKTYYDSIRLGETAKTLTVTLVPSYNCNLACPYCLQGSGKLTKKMNIKEVDAVLNFIHNKLSDTDGVEIKHLAISLYGGEAMMNKKELIYFCENTKKIAEIFKISSDYQMTTNLTLLDDSMIKMINDYQISIQVTIDGTKEQHDKKRINKNGGGTFDTIINNLEKLCECGLKDLITIRINIDNTNIDDAEKIFDTVSKYSNDVYFGFLQPFKGYNDNYKDRCVNEEQQSLIISKMFNDILVKRNFIIPQSFGKKSPCSLNCRNKYYFDCNLDVYKCELLLNQKECSVGKLNYNGDIEYNHNYYYQMNFSPYEFEKCKKCKLLPACAGGCPAKKYIEEGNKDGCVMISNCYIDEQSLNFYLKEYIERIQKNL